MIQGYEVISKDEKNQSSLVSVQEDTGKNPTIICKKDDPLQAEVIRTNSLEILKKQQMEIKQNKSLLSKNQVLDKIIAVLSGGAFLFNIIGIITMGAMVISIGGVLPSMLFYTVIFGVGSIGYTTIFVNTVKKYRNNQKTIRNLNTILSNIDMKLTRIKDLDHSPKSKQKYFKKEKGNIHFTTINVEKMKEDSAQYIQNVWYGLNHDNCAKIIKKNHRKSKITKQLEKLFEPVNVDTMTTKKFVKQIQNSSRKSL